jgi:hypothetical protein
MRSLCRWVAVLTVAAPLAFAGCKQGPGDRCQTDSDCDSDQHLICVFPSNGSPLSGGTCQVAGTGGDAAALTDLGAPDGRSGD